MQGKPNAEVGVRIGVEQLSALSAFRGKGCRALAAVWTRRGRLPAQGERLRLWQAVNK